MHSSHEIRPIPSLYRLSTNNFILTECIAPAPTSPDDYSPTSTHLPDDHSPPPTQSPTHVQICHHNPPSHIDQYYTSYSSFPLCIPSCPNVLCVTVGRPMECHIYYTLIHRVISTSPYCPTQLYYVGQRDVL